MSYRHLLSARTWVRICVLAFIGLLIVTMAMRVARAVDLTPLPTAPATGWCYAGTVCNAQRVCTYAGVQACPTSGGGGGACPAGRALTTKISHRYDVTDARVLDVTKAETIFGTFAGWTNPRLFPWDQGYTVFAAVRRGEYIAAEFTVPLTAPANQRGTIYKGESVPGPANVVAISERCGDFAPAAPYCVATSGQPGQAFLVYKLPGAVGAGCVLTPGRRYYLNIKQADPNAQDPFCVGTTCRYTLQNNHTP